MESPIAQPGSKDPNLDAWLLSTIVVTAALVLLALSAGHLSALLVDQGVPRYRLADAPAIVAGIVQDPTDPGRAWDRVNTGASPSGPVVWWTTVLVLGAVSGAAAIRLSKGGLRRKQRRGGWARPSETRALRGRHREQRLVVGRSARGPLAIEARHSVLVLGPTQSGKTTGLAIPAILDWNGPVVATSTKGDLIDHTIGWRSSLGPTHVFDPAASTAYDSAGWTPLAKTATWEGACRAAWDLAMAGKAAVGGTMSLAEFWFSGAAKALAPYLLAASATDRPIAQVARWVDAEERARGPFDRSSHRT